MFHQRESGSVLRLLPWDPRLHQTSQKAGDSRPRFDTLSRARQKEETGLQPATSALSSVPLAGPVKLAAGHLPICHSSSAIIRIDEVSNRLQTSRNTLGTFH